VLAARWAFLKGQSLSCGRAGSAPFLLAALLPGREAQVLSAVHVDPPPPHALRCQLCILELERCTLCF
jgi:hypothetical protein